jgi:antitoxin component of MazEF toxin-antitoxin module
MRTQLTRTRKGLALVLDRSLLEGLGISEKTALEVSTHGDVIVIAPVRPTKRQERLKEAMARADAEYGAVFKKLAE